MTALAWALVALAAMCAGGLITQMVFARSDRNALDACRDLLDAEQDMAAQYRSARDVAVTAHAVAEGQLVAEQNRRSAAEMQRNAAKERVRELLRKFLPHATEDEIREITADTFSTPLSIAPTRAEVPVSKQPGNELMGFDE